MNMRIEVGTTQKRKEHKVFRDVWVCMCCSHPCLIFQQVRSWLEEILWDKKGGMDVYRCKGVLSIKNSDQLHTLQVDYVFKITWSKCSLGRYLYLFKRIDNDS